MMVRYIWLKSFWQIFMNDEGFSLRQFLWKMIILDVIARKPLASFQFHWRMGPQWRFFVCIWKDQSKGYWEKLTSDVWHLDNNVKNAISSSCNF